MKVNKTTVYELTKEDIREVCYSLFVQKLKKAGVNAYFQVSSVEIDGYGDIDGELTNVWAKLIINETEEL
jgi:hypothetical protein